MADRQPAEHRPPPWCERLTQARSLSTFGPMPRTALKSTEKSALKFSAINAILLLAGLLTIGAGYVLLARGSTVAAPLLLVLGYAVLVPLGIIL